jgi:hypothetical protein
MSLLFCVCRGAAWEEAFLNAVGRAEDSHMFRHISTARFASRTLDIELERNTRTVVPYFSTTFFIMAVFSVTSCWMADWVRAKPWLGLLGNISACMGTAAAFGVTMYLGVEFIGINLAAPFLMLGKWSNFTANDSTPLMPPPFSIRSTSQQT